jgi:hypothetical protein
VPPFELCCSDARAGLASVSPTDLVTAQKRTTRLLLRVLPQAVIDIVIVAFILRTKLPLSDGKIPMPCQSDIILDVWILGFIFGPGGTIVVALQPDGAHGAVRVYLRAKRPIDCSVE